MSKIGFSSKHLLLDPSLLVKRLLPIVFAIVVTTVWMNPSTVQAVVLDGDYLRVGVNGSGGLIDGGFVVGIDYDDTGTGTWSTFDFLKPGSPFEFYSVGVGGSSSVSGYIYGNPLSATTVDTSAGTMNSTSTTGGTFGGLSLSQTLSYADSSGFIDFVVSITNTTGSPLYDVVYARGLDPDQDVYAGGGYETTNTIDSNDLVYASAPVTDWTIGIFSDSSYPHVASIRADWSYNPYSLLTSIDDGYGDYTINMAWDIGTLEAGETATIDFAYRIAETGEEVVDPEGVIPEPQTLTIWALLGVTGIIAGWWQRRRRK